MKPVTTSEISMNGLVYTELVAINSNGNIIALKCQDHQNRAVSCSWQGLQFFQCGQDDSLDNQLLQIKEVANAKNIYPQEHNVKVHDKKTLVQSMKQFHACCYWLYEKSMACAMVGLQGLHSDEAFRHPNISGSVGLKSFCPWCLKLGRNTETITIHLREVH